MRKDLLKAEYYYSIAASCWGGSCGVRDGHLALAEMYETGESVARCEERSALQYIEATSRMSNEAQWKASTFLELGTGISVHKYREFYFFDLAARG